MKTLQISVPRSRGWAIAWIVIWETLRAYWYRSPSIDFEVSEEVSS